MIEALTVIALWLVAVYAFSKLLLIDPKGWLAVTAYVLRIFVWVIGFFIIVWLTPGVPL